MRIRRRSRAALAALPALIFSGSIYAGEAPDLSGIYWASEYHAKIQLVGSGELPLTAEGKAAYEQNVVGLKDGSITDNARRFCVPDGLPRVLANPYPFEIVYGPPGQITIMYELSHQVRPVAMASCATAAAASYPMNGFSAVAAASVAPSVDETACGTAT